MMLGPCRRRAGRSAGRSVQPRDVHHGDCIGPSECVAALLPLSKLCLGRDVIELDLVLARHNSARKVDRLALHRLRCDNTRPAVPLGRDTGCIVPS